MRMNRTLRLVSAMSVTILCLASGLSPSYAQAEGDATAAAEGIWTGIVDAIVMKVPMTFKIERGSDGALSASMYSLDLGHYGTPASSVSLVDGLLTIELPPNIGKFEGRLEPAPEKLVGVVRHPVARFKASFEPADALPEFSDVAVTRTSDVIYRKKHGVALTLDVWKPEKSNGIGILSIVSGGGFLRRSIPRTHLRASR